jgi:hypothetical protein
MAERIEGELEALHRLGEPAAGDRGATGVPVMDEGRLPALGAPVVFGELRVVPLQSAGGTVLDRARDGDVQQPALQR